MSFPRDAIGNKTVVFISVYLSKVQKLVTLASTSSKQGQMSLYTFSGITFFGVCEGDLPRGVNAAKDGEIS